jgi:hypothetical protein
MNNVTLATKFLCISTFGIGLAWLPAQAPSAAQTCNTFGCSQPGAGACNPFGCPNPGASPCTPFGCPAAPPPQPSLVYPQQPYPGQQFPQQPYPGQQFPQQLYPGQQFPQQLYPGQQFPQQLYPGQPFNPGVPNNSADSLAGCLDRLTAPVVVNGKPKVREDGQTEYWYSGWGEDKEKVAGSECWGAPGFFSTDRVCWSNTITLQMKQSKALELCRPQGR